MSYLARLTDDMKVAMKSGEKTRLNTIRLLRGQLKDASIDKQKELDEDEELSVLTNAAKKRRESIEAYESAGRTDLAEKEAAELEIIQSYLPEPLTEDQVLDIINKAIQETGAQSAKDLKLVMPLVMAQVKGRADGKKVSELVRSKLI